MGEKLGDKIDHSIGLDENSLMRGWDILALHRCRLVQIIAPLMDYTITLHLNKYLVYNSHFTTIDSLAT